jgi:hypothetical protein
MSNVTTHYLLRSKVFSLGDTTADALVQVAQTSFERHLSQVIWVEFMILGGLLVPEIMCGRPNKDGLAKTLVTIGIKPSQSTSFSQCSRVIALVLSEDMSWTRALINIQVN